MNIPLGGQPTSARQSSSSKLLKLLSAGGGNKRAPPPSMFDRRSFAIGSNRSCGGSSFSSGAQVGSIMGGSVFMSTGGGGAAGGSVLGGSLFMSAGGGGAAAAAGGAVGRTASMTTSDYTSGFGRRSLACTTSRAVEASSVARSMQPELMSVGGGGPASERHHSRMGIVARLSKRDLMAPAEQALPYAFFDDEGRQLAMQMALKWADIGHLSSPLEVHLKWVQRLEEEMFRQGDQERAHGLPVSPLMDRLKGQGITKSQTGVSRFRAGCAARCELPLPCGGKCIGERRPLVGGAWGSLFMIGGHAVSKVLL